MNDKLQNMVAVASYIKDYGKVHKSVEKSIHSTEKFVDSSTELCVAETLSTWRDSVVVPAMTSAHSVIKPEHSVKNSILRNVDASAIENFQCLNNLNGMENSPSRPVGADVSRTNLTVERETNESTKSSALPAEEPYLVVVDSPKNESYNSQFNTKVTTSSSSYQSDLLNSAAVSTHSQLLTVTTQTEAKAKPKVITTMTPQLPNYNQSNIYYSTQHHQAVVSSNFVVTTADSKPVNLMSSAINEVKTAKSHEIQAPALLSFSSLPTPLSETEAQLVVTSTSAPSISPTTAFSAITTLTTGKDKTEFLQQANMQQISIETDVGLASQISEGARFSSFDLFTKAFEAWKTAFSHPFRVASSETLKNPEDGAVDENFKYRYIVYHCAFYGKPRRRGNGKRPNQNYLPCGCTAMLRLNFSHMDPRCLKITTLKSEHNGHDMSAENFKRLSKIRKMSPSNSAESGSEPSPVSALSDSSMVVKSEQNSPNTSSFLDSSNHHPCNTSTTTLTNLGTNYNGIVNFEADENSFVNCATTASREGFCEQNAKISSLFSNSAQMPAPLITGKKYTNNSSTKAASQKRVENPKSAKKAKLKTFERDQFISSQQSHQHYNVFENVEMESEFLQNYQQTNMSTLLSTIDQRFDNASNERFPENNLPVGRNLQTLQSYDGAETMKSTDEENILLSLVAAASAMPANTLSAGSLSTSSKSSSSAASHLSHSLHDLYLPSSSGSASSLSATGEMANGRNKMNQADTSYANSNGQHSTKNQHYFETLTNSVASATTRNGSTTGSNSRSLSSANFSNDLLLSPHTPSSSTAFSTEDLHLFTTKGEKDLLTSQILSLYGGGGLNKMPQFLPQNTSNLQPQQFQAQGQSKTEFEKLSLQINEQTNSVLGALKLNAIPTSSASFQNNLTQQLFASISRADSKISENTINNVNINIPSGVRSENTQRTTLQNGQNPSILSSPIVDSSSNGNNILHSSTQQQRQEQHDQQQQILSMLLDSLTQQQQQQTQQLPKPTNITPSINSNKPNNILPSFNNNNKSAIPTATFGIKPDFTALSNVSNFNLTPLLCNSTESNAADLVPKIQEQLSNPPFAGISPSVLSSLVTAFLQPQQSTPASLKPNTNIIKGNANNNSNYLPLLQQLTNSGRADKENAAICKELQNMSATGLFSPQQQSQQTTQIYQQTLLNEQQKRQQQEQLKHQQQHDLIQQLLIAANAQQANMPHQIAQKASQSQQSALNLSLLSSAAAAVATETDHATMLEMRKLARRKALEEGEHMIEFIRERMYSAQEPHNFVAILRRFCESFIANEKAEQWKVAG